MDTFLQPRGFIVSGLVLRKLSPVKNIFNQAAVFPLVAALRSTYFQRHNHVRNESQNHKDVETHDVPLSYLGLLYSNPLLHG